MKKQFWNLENDKPLQDKNSSDGVKHYDQTEKNNFMQAVVSKMEAEGMNRQEALRAYADSEMDLDIIIPNYSAREVAKYLSGKDDQSKQDDQNKQVDPDEPKWFQNFKKQQDERFEKLASRLAGKKSADQDEDPDVKDAEQWAKNLPDKQKKSWTNDNEGDATDAEQWAESLPDKD